MGHLPSSSSLSGHQRITITSHILWLKAQALIKKREQHPRALHHQKKRTSTTPRLIIIIIIMSRCCEERNGSSRVTSRQDSYDNHHKRIGEEVINNEDTREQEPKDIKKTTMTTSMTSSIMNHIWSCAISHGSRATTTCLRVIDDIISSILDCLDSSHSISNGKQQYINIKQQKRRQTDDHHVKQNYWLNIKEPQYMHIKVQQDNNIKPLVGDDIYNHHISINVDMSDISDTESTSSELLTLTEADIMSPDIHMLAPSQPHLPTPTPFDGSSPPFQEWASGLRTFLDINGFQYIAQMDIAFREDAPIHLHHLCSGTEVGTLAQDGITADKAAIKALRDELDDPGHLRDDDEINRDITTLEADLAVHQASFDEELIKVKKASDYLNYILVHQPRQHQNQIVTSVIFINKRMGLNLGDCSDSATAEVIALAPIPSCRTSWLPNCQNNINIISFEHGWRKLPAMRVNRAWSSMTILKSRR